MCGIVCIIQKNNKLPGGAIDLSLQQIVHRGPDDNGSFQYNQVSFGHCRLSILDLTAAGHQPMSSADGRYTLIFNGEIYNFQVLKAELEEKGHQFMSQSDTEILLRGFIEYGNGILDKLNGIFAFCLFDKAANTVTVARDNFGVKPLYYSENEDYLIKPLMPKH